MTGPSVISIGNFDGVHRGHRALLRQARALAEPHGARVLAITFEPHPISVLRPDQTPPRLCTFDQRVEQLKRAGADEVVVIEPTNEVLQQEPEPFLENLIRRHQALAVVEGPDFRFGRLRRGNVQTLLTMASEFGFKARIVSPVEVPLNNLHLARVSSSVIRWLVGQGRVSEAAGCLGRHYTLRAKVVLGEQRGRTIGVPTVNLDLSDFADQLVPADGVYAGLVDLPNGSSHPAAVSVGAKATFMGDRLTVEAHLLGFSGDLYEQTVSLRFSRWVRSQQRFPGIGQLKAQLSRDVAATGRLHRLGLLEPLCLPERLIESFASATTAGHDSESTPSESPSGGCA